MDLEKLLEDAKNKEQELTQECEQLEKELEEMKLEHESIKAEMEVKEEELESRLDEIDAYETGKLQEVYKEIEVLENLIERSKI